MRHQLVGPLNRRSALLGVLITALVLACGGATDEHTGEVGVGVASQGLTPTDSMPAAGTVVAGTTPGALQISRLGQASYSLPIVVAPGPGGFQPKLSIEYTSDDADGVFGLGFSLGGLSGISRCTKTVAQDGAPDSLRWDEADRFCLDGQRLVAVGGEYGAADTEYRTEVETYSRVVSRGTAHGGPVSFEVWTRDGRHLQYGATEDSRVERWQSGVEHPGHVFRWLVNRVADRVGNGYDISYYEHNGSSTAVPTAIHSFGGTGARTGQSVQLTYESRPDVKTVFHSGNFFRPHQRVKELVTRDGSRVVRRYKLAYDNGAAGGRTRLISLTECGEGDVCFSPTRFTWSLPAFRYDRRWFGNEGQGGLLTGDFNGDGRADVFTWHNGSWTGYVNYSNGSSFTGWQAPIGDLPPQRVPVVADFNGDGRSDLLTAYTDGRIFVWLSNGAGFQPRQTWSQRADLFGSFQVADFNGDGKADLADVQRGTVNVWISSGAGFWGPGAWASTSGELSFGDFDADGRTDLMEVRDHQVFVRRSDGSATGFGPESWWGTLLGGARQLTDVNGDGTTDLIVRDSGGTSHVYWSTGTKLVYTQPYAAVGAEDVFVDVNGDGKADALGFSEGVIRVGLATTHSTGFDHVPAWNVWYDAHVGPNKTFRLPTPWLTPSGAWMHGGGDFHWETSTCQELGYAPANAGFECGFRWGNVEGRTTGSYQTCTQSGEGGDWCTPQCADQAAPFRSHGNGQSDLWTPSLDYTPVQSNCREVCTQYCDTGGESGGQYCCGNGTVCDTSYCNAGGCDASPAPPGPWLESTQYRANGAWSAVFNGQVQDARCDLTIPAGQDCWGNAYVAHVGKLAAVHCQAPAKPMAADLNGDGLLDLLEVDGGGAFWANIAVGRNADVVVKIQDGLGLEHELDYEKLKDGSATYSRAAEFHRSPVGQNIEVVTAVRSSDGVGGKRAVSYVYEGGGVDPNGRGFLGFRKITSTDQSTGHVTVKTFHGGFPATGTEDREDTYAGGALVKSTQHTTHWTSSAPYVLTRTRTDESESELDGTPIRHMTTRYSGYAYGFPTTVSVDTRRSAGDTSEVVTSTTTNTFAHDTAGWILGRLTRATTTKSRTGATPETRTSSFTYAANGLLASETIEPDDASLATITSYTHDAFGNRLTATETAGALTRSSSTKFDPTGRFAVERINALGHVARHAYDGRFGTVTSTTDPNELVSTAAYDPLGRKIGETMPDGRVTTFTVQKHAGGDPTSAALVSRTTTSDAGSSTVYTDLLGRTVRKTTDGWAGKPVYVDTTYSASGLKLRESRPYFAGDLKHDHVFTYDALGRELSATTPDGAVARFAHKGRTVTEVDPRGHVKSKTSTVDGKLAAVSEVLSDRALTLTHTYDVHGQLVASKDPLGVETTITYDKRGRRTSIAEKNAGKRTFVLDRFGRAVQELDAKGQRKDHTFDLLDRTTRTLERTANNTIVRDVRFTFDTATAGTKTLRGLLAIAEVKELKAGVLATTSKRTFAYDTLGREIGETRIVDGTSLRTTRAYDAATGRLASVTYPGTLVANGLKLVPEYDSTGRVVAMRRGSASGASVWRALDADASGALLRETLENGLVTTREFDARTGQLKSVKTPRKDGLSCVPAACTPNMATWNPVTRRDNVGCFYNPDSARNEKLPTACGSETPQDMEFTFDAMGNLTQRKDRVTGLVEAFRYDELDRLTGVTGPSAKTLTYDDAGNILSKSDFGAYTYDVARKHLVTSVKRGGAEVATYAYDANGNTTTGAGRTLSWTTFDKPARIESGAAFVDFAYDDARQLALKHTSDGATTRYAGDFELETKADGTRERRTFVTVGGVVRAVHRATVAAGAATETDNGLSFLLHDHLGSTSVVTDAAATVSQRLSYDAHGKRRFTVGTDDLSGLLRGKATDKGFTGHQTLEEMSLVNMGARVYDPMLGRFLSADLVVQSTDEVNGVHRYVYGGNNPISVIDPSGHIFKKLWRSFSSIFRVVVRVVLVVVSVVVAVVAPYLLPVVAVVGGAINGAISGGIKGALIGAIFGGFTAAIGAIGSQIADPFFQIPFKALAHGLVAGAQNAAYGGDFVHGFVAGFAHGALEPLIGLGKDAFQRVAISAAVGGVASKLGGGSFENGAMTGAFQQLFNGELSRLIQSLNACTPEHPNGRPAAGDGTSVRNASPDFVEARRGLQITNDDIERMASFGFGPMAVRNTAARAGLVVAESTFLRGALRWLGSGYRELDPGVYRSLDGARVARFTTSDLLGAHGRLGPHGHLQRVGPDGRSFLENRHFPLRPDR